MRVRARTVVFRNALEKARWLDGAAKLDTELEPVQRAARSICGDAFGVDPYACAVRLHRYCRDAITYVRDAGGEQLADSAIVLWRGYDDCDGKARCFVSLCLVAGVEARTRPVFDKGDFVHVQAEIRLPDAGTLARDADGWIVAELIVPTAELGQGAEAQVRRGEYTP